MLRAITSRITLLLLSLATLTGAEPASSTAAPSTAPALPTQPRKLPPSPVRGTPLEPLLVGAWALDPVATRQPQAVGQTFHLSLPLNGTGSSALADYDQGDLVALLEVQGATRPNWTAVDVINVGGVVSGTGRRARGAFNALAIVSRPDGLNVWMDNDVGLAT